MRAQPILIFALAAALTGARAGLAGAPQSAKFFLRLPYVTPWSIPVVRQFHPECLWTMPTRENVVALTFDDGPSAKFMPALLDVLERHRIKATFFVLGSRLDDATSEAGRQRIAALRRAAQEGHEIAFHGFDHRALTELSDAEIREGIARQREQIRRILGDKAAAQVRFLRPPFGKIDRRVAKVLAEENLAPVAASILPGDAWWPRGWSEETSRVAPRIRRELHPGAIICLHVGEDLGLNDKVFSVPDAAQTVDQLVSHLGPWRVARLGDLIPSSPQKSK